MEINEQHKLKFNGVNIINVNFESFKKPEEIISMKLNINPRVFYPKDQPKVFKIVIDLQLESPEYFFLSLTAIGDFEIECELSLDEKRILIHQNSTAIMFPYIRSFISTFSANLGSTTGTLILPIHFFMGDIPEFVPSET
jgi:preprotein translocase subunit SecB